MGKATEVDCDCGDEEEGEEEWQKGMKGMRGGIHSERGENRVFGRCLGRSRGCRRCRR
jgi:hypothetical protein